MSELSWLFSEVFIGRSSLKIIPACVLLLISDGHDADRSDCYSLRYPEKCTKKIEEEVLQEGGTFRRKRIFNF